jgi:hypothetical protein
LPVGQDSEGQTRKRRRPGYIVRREPVLEVNGRNRDPSRDKEQRRELRRASPDLVGRGPEEDRGDRFQRRLACRDARLATAAPPAK